MALRHVSLDLPGAPSSVLAVDLDADGRSDLVVVLVYTEFDEVEFERAAGFLQVTEIVPALFERREARAYLSQGDGSYTLAGAPLPLESSVISMAPGPPGIPVIALTDDGAAALRLEPGETGPHLTLTPLIADAPVLRRAGSFIPGLDLIHDADGDGVADLVLPALDGVALYRGDGRGLASSPSARVSLPGDERGGGARVWRRYPIPRILDVDGDRLPDMVVVRPDSQESGVDVLRGAGQGRFHPPRRLDVRCLHDEASAGSDLAFFGDLDGVGRAELVTRTEHEEEDDGLKEAKRPRFTYRFHRLREDLTPEPRPYDQVEVLGYGFGGEWPDLGAGEFMDLDGDGRKDLVTITLDFSVLQFMRVMATKRFGMVLEFHMWSQGPDGLFRAVADQGLETKVLVDMDDFKLGRFGYFAGDFDGDGSMDFTHMDAGKTIAIHRGQAGCRYTRKPDMTIELEEDPLDPGLVKVGDLDGDGRADLAVTRPLPAESPGASPPVRLDLYLSRGAP